MATTTPRGGLAASELAREALAAREAAQAAGKAAGEAARAAGKAAGEAAREAAGRAARDAARAAGKAARDAAREAGRAARDATRGRPTPIDEAWQHLHTLVMSEKRRFMAVASELDLHPAQAGALMNMEPGQPMPMHELAGVLHCDNSNVTGIIDRLEARGLARREPYEQDRRVKHIVLTDEGVAVREQIRAVMGKAPQALCDLSAADQRALRDVLRRALGK